MDAYSTANSVPPHKFRTTPMAFYPPGRTAYTHANGYGRRPSLWQEQLSTPSDTERKIPRGKLCSIVLVFSSLLVLVTVLAIAGLALYMGALHTEPTNNIVVFACTTRMIRADSPVSTTVTDRLQRLKIQLELLYRRSVLGAALLSCAVDRLSNDMLTIYFKLSFNRHKLNRSVPNMEKLIKDILLTDAISRKPVFKVARFDPKHTYVRLMLTSDQGAYQRNSSTQLYTPKDVLKTSKIGTLLSKPFRVNSTTNAPPPPQPPPPPAIEETDDIPDENLPIIQGSFKITKTDADIIEKKTPHIDVSDVNAAQPTPVKLNTSDPTLKSSIIVESTSVTSPSSSISSIKGVSTSSTPLPSVSTATTKRLNLNLQYFDEEPWIPILPSAPPTSTLIVPLHVAEPEKPVYTSFTNPGLSPQLLDREKLGSTNGVKSHPIPINKLVTESYIPFSTLSDIEATSSSTPLQSEFVEVETINYVPSTLRNLSAIFHHNLDAEPESGGSAAAAAVPVPSGVAVPEINENLGTGHAEVVNELGLVTETTKFPLLTLIPVKSNSGIRRPLRRRPHNQTQDIAENRSFPHSHQTVNELVRNTTAIDTVTSVSTEIKKVKLDGFKVVGILNFATEHPDRDRTKKRYQGPSAASDPTANRFESLGDSKRFNILSPEKIKQLSEISNIHGSAQYKLSNKTTIHKIILPPASIWNEVQGDLNRTNLLPPEPLCSKNDFRCDNGTRCLPATGRCNQLIECDDASDEAECTCADYLRSQSFSKKICDGVLDCWDYSDETQCEWCNSGQYICENSKLCIDHSKICDGIADCERADDERQCLAISQTSEMHIDYPTFHSSGILMVRKFGKWGKLCVSSDLRWNHTDLGVNVCKSLTYRQLSSIEVILDQPKDQTTYYELTSQHDAPKAWSFRETQQCNSYHVYKIRCESLECGVKLQVHRSESRSYRIVGGSNAYLGAWPWQAALYKEGEYQCGATLINERWAISAAHCFFYSMHDHWVVRLGALRRGTSLQSPFEQLRTITRIIVHPEYEDTGFVNDIAILQMSEPVAFNDYIRPICMPDASTVPVREGQFCTAVGWGQLFEFGRVFPDTLQEVQMPIISTSECKRRTLFLSLYNITDNMFCAGFERGGRDACLGDSGGPLMCPQPNSKWTLMGITSNGYGCARANRPGVYTKVANYLQWIDSYIHSDGTDELSHTKNDTCIGHRCPLGECLHRSRLCNKFIECSDKSDEIDC